MSGYSGTPLAKKLGIGADTDVIHLFSTRRAQLERALGSSLKAMRADAVIWVSWPKKSAGVATEITEDTVRELALPLELVDVKVCAVDETWSGLKLVVRQAARAAWPRRTRGPLCPVSGRRR